MKRLNAIDGLRAIAVLMVLAAHSEVFGGNVGTRGVDLFFVLSGLCLSLPFLSRSTPVDYRKFMVARAWRILPAYWVTLAIFATALAVTKLSTTGIPPDQWSLLNNAALLPMHLSPYNGAFWTLGVEARWYLVFPLLLAIFRFNRSAFAVVGIGLYLVYIFRLIPHNVLPDTGMLPCFMLGIVAADLYLREAIHAKFVLVCSIILVTGVLLFDWQSQNHADPYWHLVAFLAVLVGLGPASAMLSWRPLVFIGRASYSIYLIHLPVLLLVLQIVHIPGVAALATALSFGAGVAFWYLVERSLTRANFERVRGSVPDNAAARTAALRSLTRKANPRKPDLTSLL